MYGGLQGAPHLEQTFQALQQRAVAELNAEIARLKKMIDEKDATIHALREETKEGSLQKRIASLLQENHELSECLSRTQARVARAEESEQRVAALREECERCRDELSLRREEFEAQTQTLQTEVQHLKSALEENGGYRQRCEEAVSLAERRGEQVRGLEEELRLLKQAGHVGMLEAQCETLQGQVVDAESRVGKLQTSLDQVNKEHEALRAKHLELLASFSDKMALQEKAIGREKNQLNKEVSKLGETLRVEGAKRQNLKDELTTLQDQFSQMEQLNLALLKGYGMKDVVRDLQKEQDKCHKLNAEVRELSKTLALRENKAVRLSRVKHNLEERLAAVDPSFRPEDEDEVSDDDLSPEAIRTCRRELSQTRQALAAREKTMQSLQEEKRKLLVRLRKHGVKVHDDDQDLTGLAFFGLSDGQKAQVKALVEELRAAEGCQHLGAVDSSESPSSLQYVDSHEELLKRLAKLKAANHALSEENANLQQWKDHLMLRVLQMEHGANLTLRPVASPRSRLSTARSLRVPASPPTFTFTQRHAMRAVETASHAPSARRRRQQRRESRHRKRSAPPVPSGSVMRATRSRSVPHAVDVAAATNAVAAPIGTTTLQLPVSSSDTRTFHVSAPQRAAHTTDACELSHVDDESRSDSFSDVASSVEEHSQSPEAETTAPMLHPAPARAFPEEATRTHLATMLGVAGEEASNADHFAAEFRKLVEEHLDQMRATELLATRAADLDPLESCDGLQWRCEAREHALEVHALRKEITSLEQRLDDLSGYKARNEQVEALLHAAEEDVEAALVKRADAVTRENMVLVVNERRLGREFLGLQNRYRRLARLFLHAVQSHMHGAAFMAEQLLTLEHRSELQVAMVSQVLGDLANAVPLTSYMELETQCRVMQEERARLSKLVDEYQTQAANLLHTKIDCHNLQSELLSKDNEIEDLKRMIGVGGASRAAEASAMKGHDDSTIAALADSVAATELEAETTKKKLQLALRHLQDVESHSAVMTKQVNELRKQCLQQSQQIGQLKLKLQVCVPSEESQRLKQDMEGLKQTVEQNQCDIAYYKKRAECAITQLQELQRTMAPQMSERLRVAVDEDEKVDEASNEATPPEEENELESETGFVQAKTGLIQRFFGDLTSDYVSAQRLKEKLQSHEVELLKSNQKNTELQSRLFKSEQARKFLESNFSCVYSKLFDQKIAEHMDEISNLRKLNHELYESLTAETQKSCETLKKMRRMDAGTRETQLRVENLETTIRQLQAKDPSELKDHLVNWQKKTTESQVKHTQVKTERDMLADEVEFLRLQCKKHQATVAGLQEQLTMTKARCSELQSQATNLGQPKTSQTVQVASEQVSTKTVQQEVIQTQTEPAPDAEVKAAEEHYRQETQRLQLEIVSLQGTIRQLQSESQHTDTRVSNVTHSMQKMLETAQQSIQNLQQLVDQKNKAIEGYKTMMDQVVHKMHAQHAQYASQIAKMQEDHRSQQDQLSTQLFDFSNAVDDDPRSIPHWMAVTDLQTALNDREVRISELEQYARNQHQTIEEYQKECEALTDAAKEYQEHAKKSETALQALRKKLRLAKTQLSQKAEESSHLQGAVGILKDELRNTTLRLSQVSSVAHSPKRPHTAEPAGQWEQEQEQELCDLRRRVAQQQKIVGQYKQQTVEMQQLRVEVQQQKVAMKKERLARRERAEKADALSQQLQARVSKLQQEKLTLQERHAQSLKLARRRNQQLDTQCEKLKREVEELKKEATLHVRRLAAEESRQKKQTKGAEIVEEKSPASEHSEERRNTSRLLKQWTALKKRHDTLVAQHKTLQEKLVAAQKERDASINATEVLKKELTRTKARNAHKAENKNGKPQTSETEEKLKEEIALLQDELSKLKKPRLAALMRENRALKKKVNGLASQVDALQQGPGNALEKQIEGHKSEIHRLTNLNRRLTRDLQREAARTKNAQTQLQETRNATQRARLAAEEHKETLEHQLRDSELSWKRKHSAVLDELERAKRRVKDLNAQIKHKKQINEKMSEEMKALLELIKHQEEVSKMEKTQRSKRLSRHQCAKEAEDEPTAEATSAAHISAEDLEALRLEKVRLADENEALRSELSAFDVSFFNEIEDLKYREREARELVEVLQAKLAEYESEI